MMTTHEKHEVLRALRDRNDLEMSPAALQQLLEDELSRPAEEMDTDLVQTLLELLEDTAPTCVLPPARQCHSRRLQRRIRPVLQRAARIAASLLVLAGVAVLLWQTAEAVNDRFLLRLINTETNSFTVMRNPSASVSITAPPASTPDPSLIGSFTVSEPTDLIRMSYTDLADCPGTMHGYPVVPARIPEGFSHVRSTQYEDYNVALMNHHFDRDGETFIFDVTIYINPEVVVNYDVDTADDAGYEVYISGVPVYFFWYSEDKIPCASFAIGMAEYFLSGGNNHEEMSIIIESTLKNFILEE